MPSWLARLIWFVTFGLQVSTLVFIARQFTHPFRNRPWTLAWLWAAGTVSLQTIRRLRWWRTWQGADWRRGGRPRHTPPLHSTYDHAELWLTLGVSVTLFLEKYWFAQTFPRRLQRLPDAPAEVTINGHGRVLGWNRAAETLFGYSAAQILGHNLTEKLVPPAHQERHRQRVQFLVMNGMPATPELLTYDTVVRHANGQEFRCDVEVRSVEKRGEDVVICAHVRRLVRL